MFPAGPPGDTTVWPPLLDPTDWLVLSFLAGVAATLAATACVPRLLLKRKAPAPRGQRPTAADHAGAAYDVTSLDELRRTIPAGKSGTCIQDAPKVINHLDDQMLGFIERSPFVHLGTADRDGLPFVSPKGDGPGFCVCENEATGKTLLIPERPGNRLVFGLQNILDNPNVGLCFQIPGTNTTLRVGGTAALSRDPRVLDLLAARGLPAILAIRVDVTYAFFHCAKAYLRSQLWQPETWPREEYAVSFGKYFSNVSAVQKLVDEGVKLNYKQVQASVDGRCFEEAGQLGFSVSSLLSGLTTKTGSKADTAAAAAAAAAADVSSE